MNLLLSFVNNKFLLLFLFISLIHYLVYLVLEIINHFTIVFILRLNIHITSRMIMLKAFRWIIRLKKVKLLRNCFFRSSLFVISHFKLINFLLLSWFTKLYSTNQVLNDLSFSIRLLSSINIVHFIDWIIIECFKVVNLLLAIENQSLWNLGLIFKLWLLFVLSFFVFSNYLMFHLGFLNHRWFFFYFFLNIFLLLLLIFIWWSILLVFLYLFIFLKFFDDGIVNYFFSMNNFLSLWLVVLILLILLLLLLKKLLLLLHKHLVLILHLQLEIHLLLLLLLNKFILLVWKSHLLELLVL